MIDDKNVERLANIFTGFFVDLNLNDKLDNVTFLEVLLGFMYSYKTLIKSMEIVEILTPEQIVKIDEVLNKVAESVKMDPESELYKLLKQIKDLKEEKDVESESK